MPKPTPPTFSQPSWNAGEDVLNSDWNSLVNYLLGLGSGDWQDDWLSNAPGQIKQRFNSLADSFRVTATALNSTLALSFTGGAIKIQPYGIIAIVAPNTLTAPANGISWVYCLNGAVAITPVQANPPQSGFLMARITSSATAVTAVNDMRSLYEEKADWDNRILVAKKSSVTALSTGNITLGIPGWSTSRNTGNQLNASTGVFTLAQSMTDLRVDASALIVCDLPNTVTASLALFAGSTELKRLGETSIAMTAAGQANILASRLQLSGFWETDVGETIAAGTQLTLQVKLRDNAAAARIEALKDTQWIIRHR